VPIFIPIESSSLSLKYNQEVCACYTYLFTYSTHSTLHYIVAAINKMESYGLFFVGCTFLGFLVMEPPYMLLFSFKK